MEYHKHDSVKCGRDYENSEKYGRCLENDCYSRAEITVNDKLHLPFANDHKSKSGEKSNIGMDKIEAQDNKSCKKRERSTFQIQSGVTKNLEGLNKSSLTEIQNRKEMATWFNMTKMRRFFNRWGKPKSNETDNANNKERLGVSLEEDYIGKKERMNRTRLLYEKISQLETERDLKVMEARQAEEMLLILRKKFPGCWTPSAPRNSSLGKNEVWPPGYTTEGIANSLEVSSEINFPELSESTSSEPQVEILALSHNSKGKINSDSTDMNSNGMASESFKTENLPVMGVPWPALTRSDEFNSLSSLKRNQTDNLLESPTFLNNWTEFWLSSTTTYRSQEGNLQHSLLNTSEREKALKAPAQETLPGKSP